MLLSSESQPQTANGHEIKRDQFLVCGLGVLGQHCVAILKDYGVAVSTISDVKPKNWELPEIPNLLDKLVIGDCRLASVLEQANIRQCRSVLLVTTNERTNIEAAFAARLLNPQVRLVIRSDKQNLNELLEKNLGNFIAFEPTQLAASAYALTALGEETIGYFKLEGQLLRVVQHEIQRGEDWCDRSLVNELNTESRRLLSHTLESFEQPKHFYEWEPEARVQAEDTVIYIEVADDLTNKSQQRARNSYRNRWRWQEIVRGINWQNFKQKIAQFWNSQSQIRRVATIYLIAVFFLWFSGTIFYSRYYPEISLKEAAYATVVLLLGGYGDLFGSVKFGSQPAPSDHMPDWLRLFSLGLTLTGEAFVGVLYAVLTDALLASKFKFLRSRPPMPKQDHVVLIGLSRLGQRVAAFLHELNQPVVGVTRNAIDQDILPKMPIVVGDMAEALAKVNLSKARSIIVVRDDHMENLEIGLMAYGINPTSSLVIRAHDRRFSENVARLFPYAQVLCNSALSAEVFACAAFGENVLSLFHFSNQTVMVTEYNIEAGDTLNGLLLSELAYGYCVIPILHQKYPQQNGLFMPSDDIRLQVGDRLFVLATSIGLQRIEWGDLLPRRWQVKIEKALTKDAIADGANEIALISGCGLNTARELMNNLPAVLPLLLYRLQAQRLVRELRKAKVEANSICVEE